MTVGLCVFIQPSAVLSYFGLSYFGNFRETVLPYGIGLTLTAYFLLRACQTLRTIPAGQSFRPGLECVAIALLGIVATPSLSSLWIIKNLHVFFGLMIFVVHAGMSLHYLIRVRTDRMGWGLLVIQVIAIIAAALSFPSIAIINLMLPAQTVAIGSFGALLLRAVRPPAKTIAQ